VNHEIEALCLALGSDASRWSVWGAADARSLVGLHLDKSQNVWPVEAASETDDAAILTTRLRAAVTAI